MIKSYFRWLLLGSMLLLGMGVEAQDASTVDVPGITAQLLAEGDALVVAYSPATGADTGDSFSELYFDRFEGSGMEMAVGLRDAARKSHLESLFSGVIGAASRGQSPEQVQQAWLALRSALHETANGWEAANGSGGFWSLMLQSFLILLREGFEAMLVITALVAYLRRQGAEAQLPVIYYGTGLALTASLLTAWAMQSLFHIAGGAAQEALEGVTMLVAAGVLFYVSYWLISKSEAARWQAWIHGQINRAISRGSLFALGFAAFLAVYREGAETVLFYQALAGQSRGQAMALVTGIGAAALALVALFWLMRNASQRLPIGIFFAATAGLLYYLALNFAGNGVLELQAAGWVGITPVDWLPRLPWLGLHPTLETFGAQLLLLAPLPFALAWWLRQRSRLMAAARTDTAGRVA